jgi:hypothetical protein
MYASHIANYVIYCLCNANVYTISTVAAVATTLSSFEVLR